MAANTMGNNAADAKYIVLDEYNFMWKENELMSFRQMWSEGVSINEIAKHFKRNRIEITLLVIDQAEKSMITPRPNGLLGKENIA